MNLRQTSSLSKKIKTKSGAIGWQKPLNEAYDHFDEWWTHNAKHGFAKRLGFADATAAWEFNPIVQGSADPDDFCRVYEPADMPARVSVFVEMNIGILVFDEDDENAPVPAWKIQESAKQAVENALKMAYDNGFTHPHEAEVSFGVVAVEVSEEILDIRI